MWTFSSDRGQDIDEFKYFKRWFEEVGERPAVKLGMQAGSAMPREVPDVNEDEKKRLGNMLYNQRARTAPKTGGLL